MSKTATHPSENNGPDDSQLSVAGEWLLRLEAEDFTQQEFTAWLEWYEADSAHSAAFDEMQARYESLRGVAAERRRQVAEVILHPRVNLHGPARHSLLSRLYSYFWQHKLVIAVPALVVGLGLTLVMQRQWLPGLTRAAIQTATYQTSRSGFETVKLPDASVVKLGARSFVSMSFTHDARYLVLEDGEAYFEVARDAARPFIVQAGAVTVKAVGTAFNVRRTQQRVVVTVSEGTVDVASNGARSQSKSSLKNGISRSVRVTAGEQAKVDADRASLSVAPGNVAMATAWQAGRLEFVNEPMNAVIATVNRYLPQDIILDDALQDISYTGTVIDGRIEEWLYALQDVFPLKVTRVGEGTVVLSALVAAAGKSNDTGTGMK